MEKILIILLIPLILSIGITPMLSIELPEAEAKKAKGVKNQQYGSATKGKVCHDRLCGIQHGTFDTEITAALILHVSQKSSYKFQLDPIEDTLKDEFTTPCKPQMKKGDSCKTIIDCAVPTPLIISGQKIDNDEDSATYGQNVGMFNKVTNCSAHMAVILK